MPSKLAAADVAKVLEEMALLLELKGENPFKIKAFQNGARIVEGFGDGLAEALESGTLKETKGIGAGLLDAITNLLKKGKYPDHQALRKEFPETLFDLFKVQGLGPKKIKALYEKLHVKSLGELEYACKENRLLKLDGFGEATQAKILKGIEYVKMHRGQFLYSDVIGPAEATVTQIRSWPEVKRAEVAGSLRRRKEIVKDVDIVCSSEKPTVVMKKFVELPNVANVLGQGDTKSSVVTKEGVQIDLRVVTDKEYPYALLHFTGSKDHNTSMRTRAKAEGFKMNEYGLFKGEKLVPCKTEEEIFEALDLAFIPPELREDQGEIHWAEKRKLPNLVELKDLRGFFHVHSTYSDGRNTLEEMVGAAAKMGIEYIGLSDHSQTATYANGLKESDLDRQHKEIDQLQKKFPKLRLFRGIESDILADGELDYPEKILKKFDFVIASVHYKFNMTEDDMTERCLNALRNPYCTMLGHATGRLLLAREGFKVRMPELIDCAAELGKIIELNANPQRLDIDWRLLSYAKKKGMKVSINPDAHSIDGLSDIQFGVNAARKGGLTKSDVLNTLPLKEMETFLDR